MASESYSHHYYTIFLDVVCDHQKHGMLVPSRHRNHGKQVMWRLSWPLPSRFKQKLVHAIGFHPNLLDALVELLVDRIRWMCFVRPVRKLPSFSQWMYHYIIYSISYPCISYIVYPVWNMNASPRYHCRCCFNKHPGCGDVLSGIASREPLQIPKLDG